MKCLITGVGGLIGSHLADFLISQECDVVGTFYRSVENVAHLRDRVRLVNCDLTETHQVQNLFSNYCPDVVFHLAAQSLPQQSWRDPERTFSTNLMGTLHLLDAIRSTALNATVVVAGSSAEYNFRTLQNAMITEATRIEPSSPYGVSKAAVNYLSVLYWESYGMKIVRVRPLFIIGPGKATNVAADFAEQIARVERGVQDCIRVGNLDNTRDFLDVRDAVRALWLVAKEGSPGDVFNICAGRGYSIRYILDRFVSLASVPVSVEVDPSRIRAIDRSVVIGDNAKLCGLGWSPKVSIEETLADTLNYWRSLHN